MQSSTVSTEKLLLLLKVEILLTLSNILVFSFEFRFSFVPTKSLVALNVTCIIFSQLS